MKICAAVLCLVAVVLAKHEVYEGYKSYYVAVESREQQQTLASLADQFSVDVLSPPLVQREGVVLVEPEHQQGFTHALREHDIQYRVHRDDVKAALEYDDVLMEEHAASTRARNGGRNLPYDDYQPWEFIDQYLQDVANRYPDIVTLVNAGNSFEGRPIRYLKISRTNFEDTSKPVVFIDGGIHAREWISIPTVTWAIHKLVEDVTESDIVNDVDFILLPLVNPDGYAYTFTGMRMWRKTRSVIDGSTCLGVDGNRNYEFAWNTVGTSPDPCSDVYAGHEPFSEVETRVVRDIVREYRDRMPLYITMHSYGSMILYPWGHDSSYSYNVFDLHRVGVAMADAIDALQHEDFRRYTTGNSGLVIGYEAAGGADDWVHSQMVPLSYTIELPWMPGDFEGFNLPPQWIERVVQETWAGVVAGIRQMRTMGY